MPKQNYPLKSDISFNNYKLTVNKEADNVVLNTTTINSADIGAIIEMLRSAKKTFKKNEKSKKD